MTIGIIGAIEEEIALLKGQMEVLSARNAVGQDFYMGKLSGKNVVLVRSGIGKVNAAVCAQILIDLYAADVIINTGVAGAIDPALDIGDLVVSKDLVQHDFDCTLAGDPLGTIPRMAVSCFPADDDLVELAVTVGKSLPGLSVRLGRIATGDQFIGSRAQKERIRKHFSPLCAEMEGGAIAQTCYLNRIPFVVIRAVSDKADESATVNFAQFAQEAAKHSSDLVEEMVRRL